MTVAFQRIFGILEFVFLFTEDIQKIFICNELRTLKECENVDEKQKVSFYYWIVF